MKRFDHRLLLVAITLGAFALRVVRLDFQPLWWDEGYSMFFATRDFGTMLARTAVDIHPPLYYALLQIWIAVAGKGQVALRLLSVAVGVAAIPLIYALAHKLFDDRRVALIAALLLALSPFHIYYSQEVRMYGLVTLLCLASVYLYVQLLGLPAGQLKTMLGASAYILVTAAALYTQYYAAFIVAFEILFFFIIAFRRSPLAPRNSFVHWITAWASIALLYLPWIIYAGGKLYTYVTAKVSIEQYAPLDPLTFLAQHFAAFSLGHLTDWTWLAWSGVVFVGLAILGYFARAQQHSDAMTQSPSLPRFPTPLLLVSLYLIVPLAFGYVVNLVYPFHPIRNERLLLIAAPAFLILVALGIVTLWHRRVWLGAAALAAVAVLSAASLYDFYTVPRYPDDDYRPLIAELQALAQRGDMFLAIYPWQIGYLETYYVGAPLDITETPSDAWNNNPALMQHDLDTLSATHPRIWFAALQTQGHILEDKLEAYLSPRDYAVVDDWFGTTRLEMYDAAVDPAPADHPIMFDSEHTGLSVNRWGISRYAVAAGEDIIRLWFDNGNLAPGTIKASLRLEDARGDMWAQDDRAMTGGMQRIGFTIPVGVPPGQYALRLAPYSAHTQLAQSSSDSAQSQVTLTTVQVVAPAQPNLAAIPNRTSIDFGNGIRLIGYVAPTIGPGIATPITLFWQATHPIHSNYTVVLQAQDEQNIYATARSTPAFGIYPTTRWQPGEIVRDPQTLMLRGDTPNGYYSLVATLDDGSSPSQTRVIGTVTVMGRPHYFGSPSPSQITDARFDNFSRLIGYNLNDEGRTVRLILYWQSLALTSTSYTVFVHAVDANGNAVAFGDAVPGNGSFPTTSWVKGEYLTDLHEFSIPADAPPGDYKIQVGLYDPKTGARLPVLDSSNKNVGDYIQLPMRITIK